MQQKKFIAITAVFVTAAIATALVIRQIKIDRKNKKLAERASQIGDEMFKE